MKLSDLQPGDKIKLDSGFTCAPASITEVLQADDGLYFKCSHGRHYLEGQERDDGELEGISAY